jgi:hypothetical protein
MTSPKQSKRGDQPKAPADEPGAERRFSSILKRALNTPPKRKKAVKPNATRKKT